MQNRVLFIAEAANPEWVSVPLVGWSLFAALRAEALAAGDVVHLVTQVRNRDAILRAGLVEGQDFTAIDTEAIARPVYRLSQALRMGEGRGWTMVQAVNSLAYPWFERKVWARFQGDLADGRFNVVHRATPLSPTVSSWIAPRCRAAGVPFILGPLNGGVPWPKQFDRERRREREWLSYIRNGYKLLPGRKATLAATSRIIVGSRHTESEIPAAHRGKTLYLPENAIDPERFSAQARPGAQDGPLRVVFVGRLVPYKGADMLIDAVAPFVRDGQVAVDIVGDGPMRAALETQVRFARLGLNDPEDARRGGVVFHGWLDHRKVQDVLAGGDLFGFPSIREFGGGAVLEAMAVGLPPLVVDYAGPGELVDPGTGFAVPIGTRADIIAALRAQIGAILADRSLLAKKGQAARDKVRAAFTWQAKAQAIRRVYAQVLRERDQSGM